MTTLKALISCATIAVAMSSVAADAVAQAPDIAAGRKRAEVCMACHGENGRSLVPGIPHLAGQDRDYLVLALTAYRGSTTRNDPTMVEMSKPLTDKDIENLAAFWNSLGPVATAQE
jgi:cytochrome c553